MAEAQELLDKTLQREPRDCSLKSREAFIPDLLSAVVVTDLLYTLPDNTVCSLTYGDTVSSISQKHLITRWKDMQFFVLDDDVLAAGKENLLAGKNGVFALLPKQQMTRFYITGQPQQPRLRVIVNSVVLVHSADSPPQPDGHDWLVLSRTGSGGLTTELSLPVPVLRAYWLRTYWFSRWAVNLLILVLFSVCFYGYIRHQLSMKTAIRRALKKGEFCLHYQPVVEIKTGKIYSLEALIRWPVAAGSSVPPDIFIPVAEQAGLICEITRYVIKQAVSDLGELHETHPHLSIAVNIFAADLSVPGFTKELHDLCDAHSLSPRYLKLEITERSLVDDAVARRNMQNLTEAGFVLVLDDFGTGYSGLSYLNKLPVSILKIDRNFIAGPGRHTATEAVVPQIVSMVRQLGMQVIAEGVEFRVQALTLSALQIQYAQGGFMTRQCRSQRSMRNCVSVTGIPVSDSLKMVVCCSGRGGSAADENRGCCP